MMLGTVLLYLLGTVWFLIVGKGTLWAALVACVFPFIPFDILKIALATAVGYPVRHRLARRGLCKEVPSGAYTRTPPENREWVRGYIREEVQLVFCWAEASVCRQRRCTKPCIGHGVPTGFVLTQRIPHHTASPFDCGQYTIYMASVNPARKIPAAATPPAPRISWTHNPPASGIG